MKYVLLLLLLVAYAGCKRPASTPTTFQLNATVGSSADVNHREHTLTFKTPPNAEVAVESDGASSVVTIDELNSDGLFTVTLSVSREPTDIEGESKFTTLIRPTSPAGSFAGGPSTYTKSDNVELNDVLLVNIDSGKYPLDSPVQVGTLNGTPIRLTVRPITPASTNGG